MSEKNSFFKEIGMKRRKIFLKIIGRILPSKISFSSEVTIFSRRRFLQFSSFITSASFLQLFISKQVKAFGGFGLMRQGAAGPPYVDDVFSAYTHTGNGGTQTITNGIDLNTKGGLIWVKCRDSGSYGNVLFDTARGIGNVLYSESNSSQTGYGSGISSLTSNSYSIGANNSINNNGNTFVSWTFRKAAKFFDIVTYTGDGTSSRSITHSLGIRAGFIFVKNTSSSSDWCATYVSADDTFGTGLFLNTTDSTSSASTNQQAYGYIHSSNPTTFLVRTGTTSGINTNQAGQTYVAYLFAHDASANGIIQCGSFATDGSARAAVTLGWEPQFVIQKRTDSTNTWMITDSSRPCTTEGGQMGQLWADQTSAEGVGTGGAHPTATGFVSTGLAVSGTMIYMAIRRPNKPPTVGTQVYNAIARTGTGTAATVTGVGFAPDLFFEGNRGGNSSEWYDRLRGKNRWIMARSTLAEATMTDSVNSFNMDGITVGTDTSNNEVNYSGSNYINWFFKRAPGVFDIVCYTGTSSGVIVPHSLGVAPELIFIKCRNQAYPWLVYHKTFTINQSLYLNTNDVLQGSGIFQEVPPTSANFKVTANSWVGYDANNTYVAYLFVTKSGISKVGTYNGTGSNTNIGNQNIDCGFAAGARFVLIKRTDSAGDWYIWDSTRGITTSGGGNDPYLSLNGSAAEVTTDDSIDTYISGSHSGFTVKQNATTNLNLFVLTTGSTYIYLAIA